MAAAHGVYNTFYSIYLVDHGYSKTVVGLLWATGVVGEVAMFLAMSKLTHRFGLRRILLASFALAVGAFPANRLGGLQPRFTVPGTTHARCDFRFFPCLGGCRDATLFPRPASFQGAGYLYQRLIWPGRHGGRVVKRLDVGSAGPTVVFSLCSAGALIAFVLMWRWVKLLPEHA